MIAKTPWSKNREREQELDKNKVYLSALAKKAQDCLNDPKFADYISMFEQYQAKTIDDIIVLNDQDPISYAFKVRQLVDTLKAYRLLISSVQEDSQRKVA